MTTKTANITFPGGLTLCVKGMILYEESHLQEAAALWQESVNKLGASGGGIGFMGSPSFVLGAVATSALLARWQQNRLSNETARLVEEANSKYCLALETGREFDFGLVENTEWPDPMRWQAKLFEDLKRKTFIPRPDGEIQFRTNDNRLIWVRWQQIAAFEPELAT